MIGVSDQRIPTGTGRTMATQGLVRTTRPMATQGLVRTTRPMAIDRDATRLFAAGPLEIGVENRIVNDDLVEEHLRRNGRESDGKTIEEDGGISLHVCDGATGDEYLQIRLFRAQAPLSLHHADFGCRRLPTRDFSIRRGCPRSDAAMGVRCHPHEDRADAGRGWSTEDCANGSRFRGTPPRRRGPTCGTTRTFAFR